MTGDNTLKDQLTGLGHRTIPEALGIVWEWALTQDLTTARRASEAVTAPSSKVCQEAARQHDPVILKNLLHPHRTLDPDDLIRVTKQGTRLAAAHAAAHPNCPDQVAVRTFDTHGKFVFNTVFADFSHRVTNRIDDRKQFLTVAAAKCRADWAACQAVAGNVEVGPVLKRVLNLDRSGPAHLVLLGADLTDEEAAKLDNVVGDIGVNKSYLRSRRQHWNNVVSLLDTHQVGGPVPSASFGLSTPGWVIRKFRDHPSREVALDLLARTTPDPLDQLTGWEGIDAATMVRVLARLPRRDGRHLQMLSHLHKNGHLEVNSATTRLLLQLQPSAIIDVVDMTAPEQQRELLETTDVAVLEHLRPHQFGDHIDLMPAKVGFGSFHKIVGWLRERTADSYDRDPVGWMTTLEWFKDASMNLQAVVDTINSLNK